MALDPIPVGVLPFQVGEKVAFIEDHPVHPKMYGIVTETGIEDGVFKFWVNVQDPETRLVEDPPVTYLATMEEIQ
ncbi:MAG TPA: hypothetical protein VGE97_09340 [Nitrososphaera sp.]|jgi:hypothetical protein